MTKAEKLTMLDAILWRIEQLRDDMNTSGRMFDLMSTAHRAAEKAVTHVKTTQYPNKFFSFQ